MIVGVLGMLALGMLSVTFQNSEEKKNVKPMNQDNYQIEVISLKPLQNNSNYYSYLIKVCATSHNLDISEVILKSDIEEYRLGVNKTIENGNCSTFGSIIKTEQSQSFNAQIIENLI